MYLLSEEIFGAIFLLFFFLVFVIFALVMS